MTKDYYMILDIPEFSTQDEIKSAYRKLARKWHPDVAGNSSDVITRFKEINEAYEVLSDKSKKADYDTARRFYNYSSNQKREQKETTNNSTNPNVKESSKKENKSESKKSGFGFNWEEFIAKKYREVQFKREKEVKTAKRGEDIYSDIEISVFEAVTGTTKVINMLQTNVCPKCGGRKFVNGTVCNCCNGKGESSSYKRFSVKIPAGVKQGSKIRLAGEGNKGINGGNNGDLYLTIHIQEPKNYKTEGLNILKTVAITPFEAVLGASISIPTIQGNVSLKINPNTQNGQKVRLSGCGIQDGNKTGDMIVTLEIQIPKSLTDEEVELYKRLQEISSSKVREY